LPWFRPDVITGGFREEGFDPVGYAGGVCNFLKKNSPDNARLKGHANDVADKLKAAQASGKPSEDS